MHIPLKSLVLTQPLSYTLKKTPAIAGMQRLEFFLCTQMKSVNKMQKTCYIGVKHGLNNTKDCLDVNFVSYTFAQSLNHETS